MSWAASRAGDLVACEQEPCGCRGHGFAWVSERLGWVFYEVPKCGSTSVRAALGLRLDGAVGRHGFRPVSAAERAAIDPAWPSVAVVRDPWSRLVSNWAMFCGGAGASPLDPNRGGQFEALFADELGGRRAGGVGFAEFVRLTGRRANHHWAPCAAFVPVAGGVAAVDHLCGLDTLAEDLGRVLGLMGLPTAIERRNATGGVRPAGVYTPELARMVGGRYAEDVAAFGFERPAGVPG